MVEVQEADQLPIFPSCIRRPHPARRDDGVPHPRSPPEEEDRFVIENSFQPSDVFGVRTGSSEMSEMSEVSCKIARTSSNT